MHANLQAILFKIAEQIFAAWCIQHSTLIVLCNTVKHEQRILEHNLSLQKLVLIPQ